MLDEILNTALGPLKVKAWGGILLALALLAWVVVEIADNRDKRLIETAQDSGAAGAVIDGQNTTFDQLGDANDAETDLRDSGERSAARFNQCLQDSRRKSACKRYRPIEDQLVPRR